MSRAEEQAKQSKRVQLWSSSTPVGPPVSFKTIGHRGRTGAPGGDFQYDVTPAVPPPTHSSAVQNKADRRPLTVTTSTVFRRQGYIPGPLCISRRVLEAITPTDDLYCTLPCPTEHPLCPHAILSKVPEAERRAAAWHGTTANLPKNRSSHLLQGHVIAVQYSGIACAIAHLQAKGASSHAQTSFAAACQTRDWLAIAYPLIIVTPSELQLSLLVWPTRERLVRRGKAGTRCRADSTPVGDLALRHSGREV